MRGLSGFTDFFLICSGTSEPHLRAIAGEIRDQLKVKHGLKAMGAEGYPVSQWMILDYSDVVIHIFHENKRSLYGLEDLWSDAPRLELPVL